MDFQSQEKLSKLTKLLHKTRKFLLYCHIRKSRMVSGKGEIHNIAQGSKCLLPGEVTVAVFLLHDQTTIKAPQIRNHDL